MKKTIITTFLILALVLSSGINAQAFAGSDVKVHTRASVSDFFSETSYSNIVKNIFSWTGNSFNFTPTIVYNKLNNLPSDALGYDNYFLTFDSDGYLSLICYNGSSFGCINNTGYQSQIYYDDVRSGWSAYIPCVNGGYSFSLYRCGWGNSDTWSGQGYTYADSNAYHASTFGGVLLSTNMPLYYFDELNMKSIPHSGVISENLYSHPEIYDLMTDFNSGLPYVDGEGNIVDPTPVVESNANHMYFKSCDIGFCEPTGINNFRSFGGAYTFCRYSLDDWVVNHISEYRLEFSSTVVIGDRQNNFSYSCPVDRNGLVVVPFTDMFSSNNSSSAVPINSGFVAVIGSQKVGQDYNICTLYSVANDNVPNFVRKLDSEYNYNLVDLGWSALRGGSLKYIISWISDGGTKSLNNLSSWSEEVVQSFNPFIIRIQVKLVAGSDESSTYAEKFDLYTGDQSTVDTGGLVNPDPFEPEIDQNDGDLPVIPEEPNSTTPSVIVYTGGTWQGNLTGGFDPGYRELKVDVDQDSDGNFTQYLDPMHNTSVGAWFMSFVDAMPAEMKALLITGTGVGIFFGLYRFIRRG